MRWYGVFILGLVLLAGGASPAAAQHARDHVRAGRVQPLDRILEGVRRSQPGTFYDAEGPFEGSDGRYHYRLKWMTPSGRIIWLDTDASTGRVLGVDHGQRPPVWEGGRRNYRERDYEDRDDGGRSRYRNSDRRGDGYRDDRSYRSRHDHNDRSDGGRREYRSRRNYNYNDDDGRGRRRHRDRW